MQEKTEVSKEVMPVQGRFSRKVGLSIKDQCGDGNVALGQVMMSQELVLHVSTQNRNIYTDGATFDRINYTRFEWSLTWSI